MTAITSEGTSFGGHNLRPRRGRGAPPPERRRGVSPLHDVLEDLPDMFAAEVLARLEPAAGAYTRPPCSLTRALSVT